jgi:hypothetical protein
MLFGCRGAGCKSCHHHQATGGESGSGFKPGVHQRHHELLEVIVIAVKINARPLNLQAATGHDGTDCASEELW